MKTMTSSPNYLCATCVPIPIEGSSSSEKRFFGLASSGQKIGLVGEAGCMELGQSSNSGTAAFYSWDMSCSAQNKTQGTASRLQAPCTQRTHATNLFNAGKLPRISQWLSRIRTVHKPVASSRTKQAPRSRRTFFSRCIQTQLHLRRIATLQVLTGKVYVDPDTDLTNQTHNKFRDLMLIG